MIRETGMKLPYAAHECSASTTAPRDTSAYTSAIAYLREREQKLTRSRQPVNQPVNQLHYYSALSTAGAGEERDC